MLGLSGREKRDAGMEEWLRELEREDDIQLMETVCDIENEIMFDMEQCFELRKLLMSEEASSRKRRSVEEDLYLPPCLPFGFSASHHRLSFLPHQSPTKASTPGGQRGGGCQQRASCNRCLSPHLL